MENSEYFNKLIKIHEDLLLFLDDDEEKEEEKYRNFIKDLKEHYNNRKVILFLLSKIVKNRHRSSTFINKIEKIILDISDMLKSNYENHILFEIFKRNKIILALLIKHKIITINYFNYLKFKEEKKEDYLLYLFPEFKDFYSRKESKKIKEKIYLMEGIDIEDKKDRETFEEKRLKGENGHYICELIRNDYIDEFVSYMTRTNINPSSKIKPSIFETNSFLIKSEPTLIEYAAFYGAITIFNYLRMSGAELTPKLPIYAIHSNNAELIHIVEELNFKKEVNFEINCINESIKCHHLEIANYCIYKVFYGGLVDYSTSIKSLNFAYFPTKLPINDDTVYKICKYDLFELIKPDFLDFLKDENNEMKKDIFKCVTVLNNTDVINFCIENLSIIKKTEYFTSFASCPSLLKIEIPSSYESISDNMFRPFKYIREIVIPSSVTSIGKGAFMNLEFLKTVKFESSSSLESIGDAAFNNCISLESISIPSTVESIGEYAFYNCKSLKEITIPPHVTMILERTFENCTSLTKVRVPSTAKYVDWFAFSNCISLDKIEDY